MSYEQQREVISKKLQDFSGQDFEALALDVFRFQAAHNELYARYISLLGIDIQQVGSLAEIPFLPIQFFKNHVVKTGHWQEETIFSSSGTGGMATGRHYVRDLGFYKKNTVNGFRQFYGDPAEYCLLALLPSYLERSGSSLVCMAGHFIQLSKHPESGFFLNNTDELLKVVRKVATSRKTLLLGVSFALLDLAEGHPFEAGNCIVMETGGMKGRRRELTRHELHEVLKRAFKTDAVHSEYGMTELFSQAWSAGGGKFYPASTLRVLAREITDPLSPGPVGKTGALNMIDLANFDTCSFIATDDLGRVYPDTSGVGEDGAFEVLGRLDDSDTRGCNLLVEMGGGEIGELGELGN